MNKGGRPPKYKTAKGMQKVIDWYFEHTDKPTVSGLSLALGFNDVRRIFDYEERDEFTQTVKKARARIMQWYEEHLGESHAAGSIFALKNFGWRDTKDISVGGNVSIILEKE
jgi:hypothetical protein